MTHVEQQYEPDFSRERNISLISFDTTLEQLDPVTIDQQMLHTQSFAFLDTWQDSHLLDVRETEEINVNIDVLSTSLESILLEKSLTEIEKVQSVSIVPSEGRAVPDGELVDISKLEAFLREVDQQTSGIVTDEELPENVTRLSDYRKNVDGKDVFAFMNVWEDGLETSIVVDKVAETVVAAMKYYSGSSIEGSHLKEALLQEEGAFAKVAIKMQEVKQALGDEAYKAMRQVIVDRAMEIQVLCCPAHMGSSGGIFASSVIQTLTQQASSAMQQAAESVASINSTANALKSISGGAEGEGSASGDSHQHCEACNGHMKGGVCPTCSPGARIAA